MKPGTIVVLLDHSTIPLSEGYKFVYMGHSFIRSTLTGHAWRYEGSEAYKLTRLGAKRLGFERSENRYV